MGHHSYLRIGAGTFFWRTSSYERELAALFSEADRHFAKDPDEDDGQDQYLYGTTAWQMRQRLKAHGFSTARAWAGLERSIREWSEESRGEHPYQEPERIFKYFEDGLAGAARFEEPGCEMPEELPPNLEAYLDCRDVLRLLLDLAPNETLVALDLSELTGCCVQMDPQVPVAGPAREQQVWQVAAGSPLIVLTEGSTDSSALAAGMKVTHPHLVGFVNIIDSAGFPAEGGAAALARMVYSFAASGVANHVVAIADNDTAAYTALEKVKSDPKLPARFKILHYPDLPLLEQYPTLGPYQPDPVPANVNGTAGALEMYLGRDVLASEGCLAPVQWTSWDSKAGRYQGSLLPADKRRVQQAFRDKVAAEERGEGTGADWTGIKAIIDRIIGAID